LFDPEKCQTEKHFKVEDQLPKIQIKSEMCFVFLFFYGFYLFILNGDRFCCDVVLNIFVVL